MKKKIMIVVQSPGGVERYIKMLLKYLKRSDFEIILVCSNDYIERKYLKLVDKFINVNMCRDINISIDLRGIIQIRKLIKKYNPEILYLHSSKAGALGRIANLGLKNRVLYNPHGWSFCMDCSSMKKNIYRLIEKILAIKTDKIIAISECEKSRAVENNICKADKIEVILNGIDINEYEKFNLNTRRSRLELNIPQDAYVIGAVGRICDNKAPDIFVKSASIIKKHIPNAFFVLVGDGPDRTYIENLIKEYSLEECTLITGWVEEPFEYINCFQQGMLLTRWEGFGLVLAEYMIAKVPLIATNIDSIPELITQEVNGLLVDVNDIEGTITASVRIYKDNDLRQKITENGYKIVKNKFDVKRNVREHEELFKEEKRLYHSAKNISDNGCI